MPPIESIIGPVLVKATRPSATTDRPPVAAGSRRDGHGAKSLLGGQAADATTVTAEGRQRLVAPQKVGKAAKTGLEPLRTQRHREQDLPPRSHADDTDAGSSASPRAPAAPAPFTGKVYALKDGSGYVAFSGDGRYYRVEVGSGHGLLPSRSGGMVDAAQVDLARGPVRAARLASGTRHEPPPSSAAAGHPDAADQTMSSGRARNPVETGPAPTPVPPDAVDPQRARELMQRDPAHALRSHANIDPCDTVSLLD